MMAKIEIQDNKQNLAIAAAAKVASDLAEAIERYGSATWVLAGGTAPMDAYKILAQEYKDRVDWQRVTVIIGDERCVPKDHPDSNWFQINRAFLSKVPIPEANQLRPHYELPAEEAAAQYEQVVDKLPKTENGLPRLDHVWLGMGEDGHTLSLFPNHPALRLKEHLVIPVHDSPKPPPDRISLTLWALEGTTSCLIMAAGAGKSGIVAHANSGDMDLPIARAIKAIETNGGNVTWLLDTEAAQELPNITT